MKKITITISDKVFSELRTYISLKCMTDEVGGVADAFIIKIIRTIDDGESEVNIKIKGEKEDDILSGEVSDSS